MSWNPVGIKSTDLKRASRWIHSAHNPLLLCHVAPDGDAIGSMMGLCLALRQIGLHPSPTCADPIPATHRYIPAAATIAQKAVSHFDLVIALDCADEERMGRLTETPAFRSRPLLNIDHHLTNTYFGDLNLVDADASSSAEIVLRLLDAMGVPLTAEIATALLAGIVTDTRGFRTRNVTTQTLKAALRLMQAGASLYEVSYHGLDRRPLSAIRLWGEALAHLQIENGVIWLGISREMRRAAGHTGNSDANLANFLIGAEEADAVAVFVECEDGQVEVGLRAKPGLDISQVASQFGGGGHALAAGCRLAGPLEEAQSRVLETMRTILADQRQTLRQPPS